MGGSEVILCKPWRLVWWPPGFSQHDAREPNAQTEEAVIALGRHHDSTRDEKTKKCWAGKNKEHFGGGPAKGRSSKGEKEGSSQGEEGDVHRRVRGSNEGEEEAARRCDSSEGEVVFFFFL